MLKSLNPRGMVENAKKRSIRWTRRPSRSRRYLVRRLGITVVEVITLAVLANLLERFIDGGYHRDRTRGLLDIRRTAPSTAQPVEHCDEVASHE